jgi:tetratricopeptide (TPR) repeat protein/predicted Ser/Thr protein kinase
MMRSTVSDAGPLGPQPEPDDDLAAQQMKQAIRAGLFGGRVDPVRIDRFTILRRLGAGAMGVVFAAYDERLDRKIALKLLRAERSGIDDERQLLREAQAMARLAHPNVVVVHEVGIHEGQVFLAMEFIEGHTLRAWLASPRAWREIVERFVDAGRGLAAAHATGLVHRDFKPDNVLVGADGRTRVLDFGLARRADGDEPVAADPDEHEETAGAPAGGASLTLSSNLAGTPAYMAPELLTGQRPDARSDQFSFCVALYEGLYGRRPFAGATLDELFAAAAHGEVRAAPSDARVPTWLRRAVLRGLSPEPAERWSSMSALLTELGRDPGRARARMLEGLGLVGALALVGAGVEGYRRFDIMQRTAACEASGAEVETAWNPERGQQLHDALVATGTSYGSTTAEKVMPWLQQQADAWREARVEACLDTEVRGRWDAQTLDRSLWCLNERRVELESLVDELTLADAEVLHKAVTAAAGLASVAPCRDERMLEWLTPPPEEQREAVRAVRADVTHAGNLELVGRYGKGLDVARGALERAEALEWRPLSAAARLRLGSLQERAGAYAEAETALETAYFEATERVAPEVALDAAVTLVFVVGDRLARPTEGRRWSRHAEAALASIRDGEGLHRARLLSGLADLDRATGAYDEAKAFDTHASAIYEQVLGPEHPYVATSTMNLANDHASAGDHDDAKVLYERAIAIQEQVLGPEHPDLATSLNNLAGVHLATGAYEEAKMLYERAIAIQEQVLGSEHPKVARNLSNLAGVHVATGAYEEAKALNERALAIRAKALGPEHPDLATSLNNLAYVHQATGGHQEARALNERALAIREKALGPEHPDVGHSLSNLASFHRATGAYEEAKALYERALAIFEKVLGPEHPDVAIALNNLANVHSDTGSYQEAKALHERALAIKVKALGPEHRDVASSLSNLAVVHEATGAHDEARVRYEQALGILDKALGPEHPNLAYTLVGLARIALAQRRPTDAVSLAQRAVTVREKAGVSALELGYARFVLAQALWEAPADGGRDRSRAVVLAEQARDAFMDAGESGTKQLDEVEEWLDEH